MHSYKPRFSSRLQWDLRANRISTLLEAKRAGGARILDLTESNPTAAGLSYPSDEIAGSLADAHALLYEPSASGLLSAREAIASRYTATEADRIILTASTSEAYSYLFKLLAD
ncbi:MAG: pyridoxal phosphate-dependent aminotransferase, partial [Bryobacteraceae bacterium]